MADDLDSPEVGELDESGFDSEEDGFVERAITGGNDLSLRRKIEERLERKRLMDEYDLLDGFDF